MNEGRSQLEDLCRRFRESDEQSPEIAILVVDDPPAQRICVAWGKIGATWEAPDGDPPENLEALWEWVWDGVDFDLPRLARAARVSEFAIGRKFESLRGCRAIYPDGSMSKWCSGILRGAILKSAPRRPQKEQP